MPRNPARIEEFSFRLDKNFLIRNFKPVPEEIRRWYTNNIIQHTISILAGDTGNEIVPVGVSKTGLLYTASVGVPYLHQKVFAGNASDAYGSDLVFPESVDRIDIFIWDYAAIIKRCAPDSLYDEEFEIPANSVYSFDATTSKINIKNKTATQTARYQIIGWY